MKNTSFVLCIFLYLLAVNLCIAESRYIPDSNFRKWLQSNYASCMNGDSLVKECIEEKKIISLKVDKQNIADLTGLEYFIHLTSLRCTHNQLTRLPPLPGKLTGIDCSHNLLTQLPACPPSLNVLFCAANQLTSLPALPDGMWHIRCGSNQLTSLPLLPLSLKTLRCDFNQLTQLPDLPGQLEHLDCGANQLVKLPELPARMRELLCEANKLTNLPPLPAALQWFTCADNQLTWLPDLPTPLRVLVCSSNQLINLPDLPPNLYSLSCENNLLTSLPPLPAPMGYLFLDNNRLAFEALEGIVKNRVAGSVMSCSGQAPIDVHPGVRVIGEGQTLVLSVSTGGTASSYQWFRNDMAVSDVSDSPEYRKANFSEVDAGVYTCRITNPIVTSLVLTTTPVVVQSAANRDK